MTSKHAYYWLLFLFGTFVGVFVSNSAGEPNTQTPNATITGPLRINDKDGHPLLGVWYSNTKGTMLRMYDKDGLATGDFYLTKGPASPKLTTLTPSSDGP